MSVNYFYQRTLHTRYPLSPPLVGPGNSDSRGDNVIDKFVEMQLFKASQVNMMSMKSSFGLICSLVRICVGREGKGVCFTTILIT